MQTFYSTVRIIDGPLYGRYAKGNHSDYFGDVANNGAEAIENFCSWAGIDTHEIEEGLVFQVGNDQGDWEGTLSDFRNGKEKEV